MRHDAGILSAIALLLVSLPRPVAASVLNVLSGTERLERGGALSLVVDAPADGTWNLTLDYELASDRTLRPTLSVLVNEGTTDERESILSLDSLWRDDSKHFALDRYGNEMLPQPVRQRGAMREALFGNTGLSAFPEAVRLHRGRNTLRLLNTVEPLILRGLTLTTPPAIPTYGQYRAALGRRTGAASPALIAVEAESYALKNDSFIRLASLEDPSVTPYRTDVKLLNALDAGSWRTPGQVVSWDVEVPEDGFLTLAVKYAQPYREDFPVFRTVEIDGAPPFAEMISYPFPFTRGRWRTEVLSDAHGVPFQLWLSAGRHTVTLRIDAERLREGLGTLQDILTQVNDLGISLKKLTGNQLDRNRTWVVADYLPDVEDRLIGWADRLASLHARWSELEGVTDRAPGALVDMRIAADKLRALAREPDRLPDRLSELSEGEGSVAQLVGGLIGPLTRQPLELDRFSLFRGSSLPRSDAGAAARVWEGVKRFVLSFRAPARAYQADGMGTRELNAWVNRPLPLVQVLQQMADAAAARGQAPAVRLSVMPDETKLVLAVASKSAPDIGLGIRSHIPYELALRGALVDLAGMPGFAGFLAEGYLPESIVPYAIGWSVYGMTETQDFFVLFYRRDILSRFHLAVPDTWDDVIAMLPELQRYAMNFAIPMAGWSGLKPFYTTTPFIYQEGGTLYSEDGMRSELGSPEAMKGMELMTDLFTLYSIPQQVPNFYDSFRYGMLPVGISNFATYVQLTFAAPEIAGLWDIAPSPGIRRSDGTVDRSQSAVERADVLFSGGVQGPSWDFLRWWLAAGTQVQFAARLQTTFGPQFMWNTANMKAFDDLPLPEGHKRVILEQWSWLREVPRHPGGYMTEREISNAWSAAVLRGVGLREAVDRAVTTINRELARKLEEFGYLKDGVKLRDYEILNASKLLGAR